MINQHEGIIIYLCTPSKDDTPYRLTMVYFYIGNLAW